MKVGLCGFAQSTLIPSYVNSFICFLTTLTEVLSDKYWFEQSNIRKYLVGNSLVWLENHKSSFQGKKTASSHNKGSSHHPSEDFSTINHPDVHIFASKGGSAKNRTGYMQKQLAGCSSGDRLLWGGVFKWLICHFTSRLLLGTIQAWGTEPHSLACKVVCARVPTHKLSLVRLFYHLRDLCHCIQVPTSPLVQSYSFSFFYCNKML